MIQGLLQESYLRSTSYSIHSLVAYFRSSVEPGSGYPNKRPPSGYDDRMNRRNNENFPDNQQVFVGNLPMDISELGLKRFFNRKKFLFYIEL